MSDRLEDVLGDDSLLRVAESIITGWDYTEDKYDVFKYARYDWSSFDPKKFGYEVIRLGGKKGYFTIVSRSDFKRLSKHKWKPRVIYDRDEDGERNGHIIRVDACRTVRKKGKDFTVYMHRVIIEAGPKLDVDHEGGLALDNRRPRLRCVTRTANNHNWAHRERLVNTGLPRGVEWADSERRFVRGIIWWSVSGKRKLKRSKRMPFTPENVAKAHAWYLKERNKLYSHKKWAAGGVTSEPPKFPPLRRESSRTEFVDQIPF